MKILFVWPNKDNFGYKPIGISILSALLKQRGHETALLDTTFFDQGQNSVHEVRSQFKIFKTVNLEKYNIDRKKVCLENEVKKIINSFHPDIVAVSALSDEINIGIRISKIVKEVDSKIIVLWGNKPATLSPETIFCDVVDYVCIGEGIEFITEFVDALENHRNPEDIKNLAYKKDDSIICNELHDFFQNLDALPFLDWEIFDKRQFLKVFDGRVYQGGDYMMEWGCPYSCTYCINHAYRKLYKNKGRYIRSYGINRIIDEIKYLTKKWSIEFYKFHDEDFCLKSENSLQELSEKYKQEVNIPFTIMANARNVTEKKAKLLKQMNCVSVSIGIETGNLKLRKEILKRTETPEEIIKAVHILNDCGIRTSSFNMLGIPFESRESIMETIELNIKCNIQHPNTVFFYPLEKTDLKEVAIQHGFIDNTHYNFNDKIPTLKFKNLSTEELIAIRERFALYVKLPRNLHPFIRRSEVADMTGDMLTNKLFCIYENYINNGQNDTYQKLVTELKRLWLE